MIKLVPGYNKRMKALYMYIYIIYKKAVIFFQASGNRFPAHFLLIVRVSC